MTKLSSITHGLGLLVCLLLPAAQAAPAYCDKPYEATIENVSSNTTSHSWNDGRGKMRTETNVGGVNRASIMDFNARVTYSIDDQNKTVMKMPMNFSPEQDPKNKWETIPGVRVVEGHPCTGKRMLQNGSQMEVWTGNDTGCSVLVSSNGRPVMKLRSYKPAAPNPSLFSPPAGYKVVDMADMMKNVPH